MLCAPCKTRMEKCELEKYQNDFTYQCQACLKVSLCRINRGVIYCSNCHFRYNAAVSNDKFEQSFCIQDNPICDNILCNYCFRLKVNSISDSTVCNKYPVSVDNDNENTYSFFLEELKKENKPNRVQQLTNQNLKTKHDRCWNMQQEWKRIKQKLDTDLQSTNRKTKRKAIMISIQLIFNIRSGFKGKQNTIVNKCYQLDANVFSALMQVWEKKPSKL